MDKLSNGEIGYCTNGDQIFCVKRHLDGNHYECYWAVFMNSNIINEECRYFVHYRAQKKHISNLRKYLKQQGYYLFDNKIYKNEF